MGDSVRHRTYSRRHAAYYEYELGAATLLTARKPVEGSLLLGPRVTSPRSLQSFEKVLVMKIPVETKPALWGMAGGAIAAMIVGFSWGGWVTGGSAEAAAAQRANAAVVVALAPVCVERFQRASDVPANLDALKKVDTWSQGDFIEKGGWATAPGSKPSDQVSAVAKACALLLAPA